MKIFSIWEAARPNAVIGKAFTADIAPEQLNVDGKRLDMLKLGLKGAIATAAVAIEDFIVVLSEFVVKVGGTERIKMNLQDLAALSVAMYGEKIAIGENTDNTGNNFVGGVQIPIYAPMEANRPITVSAARTAVTNVATEVVALTGYADYSAKFSKPIHAVKVAHTTAGSAGYELLGAQIAPMGVMKKLLVRMPNGFADGNTDVSVQRVNILVDGVVAHELNSLADAKPLADIDFVTPGPLADLLRPYLLFDFGDEGIDVKSKRVTLQLDVQDVSDAIAYIPIIEMA